jgi:hypothetical protein
VKNDETTKRAAKNARTEADKPKRKGGTADSPRQLSIQEQAFYMSVMKNMNVRQIGEALGIDKTTAAKYIRQEEERRAAELGQGRELRKARAIAFYEGVGLEALQRAKKAFGERCYSDVIKARERIDKLEGLEAPVDVNIGVEELLNSLIGTEKKKTKAQ